MLGAAWVRPQPREPRVILGFCLSCPEEKGSDREESEDEQADREPSSELSPPSGTLPE